MADPIRPFLSATSAFVRKDPLKPQAGYIRRTDPLSESVRLLSSGQFRAWFEPDWGNAVRLAVRFPHCAIYSIPYESVSRALYKTPGWRMKRHKGAVL